MQELAGGGGQALGLEELKRAYENALVIPRLRLRAPSDEDQHILSGRTRTDECLLAMRTEESFLGKRLCRGD